MTATAIGLDVGTNAVRAVEIEFGEPPLIRRMGQVGLPAGAVVDGEVADVDAVSIALRRLWTEAGFKSRTVRAGISSARVIVRTVEMPRLSHDELMSTIRLQLDDYVPLAAEDTVFDVRPLDGPDESTQTMQLLLAAAHRDAVEPLVMALRDAKLDVTAIDVIPAALALALTHPEPDQDDTADVVLSIGAGTVVVIAARGGEPMYSRTITSACGRLMTDRIASQLAIGELDAERFKRSGATEDPNSGVAVLAARAGVDELIEEVRASLAFFADQPNGRPVRRLLVTGGGSLLPGLAAALAGGLGLDVVNADPFAGLRLGDTGFESCDLPHLAPYMGAAIGVALGANRPQNRRIDLTPQARRASRSMGSRRVLLAAGAVVVVGGLGALYVQGRSQLADQQSRLSTAYAAAGRSADPGGDTPCTGRRPIVDRHRGQPGGGRRQRCPDQRRLARCGARHRGRGHPARRERGLDARRARSGVGQRGPDPDDSEHRQAHLVGQRTGSTGGCRLDRRARRRPEVRRAMGRRSDDDHPGERLQSRAVHDGCVNHGREPRRSRCNRGDSMNRSRKDIVLMFAMGAMLVFAVFNFVFKPQRSDLSGARSEVQHVEQDISDAQLTLRAPVNSVADPARASSTAIPETPEISGLLRQLHAIAEASSVTLGSIGPNPLTPNPSGPGGSLTFAINASGPHEAVLAFVQQLRDMDRLTVVEQVGIVRQPATDTSSQLDQLQMTVRVFTQLPPAIAPMAASTTSAP